MVDYLKLEERIRQICVYILYKDKFLNLFFSMKIFINIV